jgi:hypothetical protein
MWRRGRAGHGYFSCAVNLNVDILWNETPLSLYLLKQIPADRKVIGGLSELK